METRKQFEKKSSRFWLNEIVEPRRHLPCAVMCAVLVLLLIICLPLAWEIHKRHSFHSLKREIRKQIESLEDERPTNITPEHWKEAISWTITAFANVWPWNSSTHSALEEFSEELDQRIAAGDGLATLRWISDELERRFERGPTYVAIHCPRRALNPDPITDETLESFWGLENCYHLYLYGTEVGDGGLHHLARARKLQHLYLGKTHVTDAGLAQLPELQLTGLSLAHCQIDGSGLADLHRMPGLEYLSLRGTVVTDERLAALKQLPALRTLDLESTGVTDNGLVHLMDLTGIRVLDLASTHVAGPGLRYLAGLANLRDLDLGRTPVTGPGLEALSQLKDLDLEESRITSPGLASISELVYLEKLDLNDTEVSDDGLEHLAKLPRLRSLSLEGTRVTSRGLRHLQALASLEHLYLSSSVDDDGELQRLSQAIPGCRIRNGNAVYYTRRGT